MEQDIIIATDARELLQTWSEGTTHIIEAAPPQHHHEDHEYEEHDPDDGETSNGGMTTTIVHTIKPPKASRRSQTEAARGALAEPNALRPATTKAGKQRIRMKWSQEVNQFIMRTYYTITNLETDTKAYRDALHRLFNQQYPDVSISQQRIADQRRAIVKNNLLPTAQLEEIKAEVAQSLQMKTYMIKTCSSPAPPPVQPPTQQAVTIKQEIMQQVQAAVQTSQPHQIHHQAQLVSTQPHHIIIVETTNPALKRHFMEESSTI